MRPRRIRTRRGFTFVELLIVMIIMGMLAGIALLRYVDLKHRARSAQVASDLNAVRLAVYAYWADKGSWPSDADAGAIPSGLASYLRKGFDFGGEFYTLDYDNTAPPGPGRAVSVRVTSSDPRLMATLGQVFGNGATYYMMGSTLTFVIVGDDGQM